MIYKREEYIDENAQDEKFPVKRIDALTPLDDSATKFIGQVALGVQTPMGVQQIPVSFEIEAASPQEAFQKFEAAALPRIEETRRQIEDEIGKLRQDASSRIVRPGEVGMPAQGGVIDFNKLK